MKQLVLVSELIFISVLLFSCKKDETITNNTSISIIGRWLVVTDSGFDAVGINNHTVNYTGQTGDYFDFRTSGEIYTKEGSVLDTLHYTLNSDNTIIISSFGIILNGVPQTCSITNLTAHSVTIAAPLVLTPGGAFGRKVNLRR